MPGRAMPEIGTQMAIAESRTSDLLVGAGVAAARSSLQEAVQNFAPYDRVQEVNESVRSAPRELVELARVGGRPAFIFAIQQSLPLLH